MNNRCLICARAVDGGHEYHPRCSRRFFGVFPPPVLDISLNDLREYAARSVLARITVTGVQKKLSLGIECEGRQSRFTIVGLWGGYILKPPAGEYADLPQNEDAVMRLAASVGIPVVPHALIRLSCGELAYITKRIDRTGDGDKLNMEDFCQISGRLTEDKYRGSLERVGKLIRHHSVYPGLDAVDFFRRVVFSFLTANADMHLKNYSLVETPAGNRLSPAYDLLSTILVIPDDPEESALTINGKKSNLRVEDFRALAHSLEIAPQAYDRLRREFGRSARAMRLILKELWLPIEMQDRLGAIIEQRSAIFTDHC